MPEILQPFDDEHFMRQALNEAMFAYEKREIPVGAVVVWKNRIIARGHNATENLHDPTAHAEMIALTAAFDHIGGKFLDDCSFYVTLEPCTMCAGAIHWARPARLIFGASDIKKGYRVYNPGIIHPKTEVKTGVLAAECEEPVKRFFKEMRERNG